ncbi:MAG: flagellar basal body rod protein FlgC [Verrucomicrobiia bacterium]
MAILSGIQSTSSALQAERIRMEVIAQNIAHMHTTRGLNGEPYQRQQLVFESVLNQAQSGAAEAGPRSVRVVGVQVDSRPPRLVYNPTHPEADAHGMVAMPNINMHEEMADLIVASRAYEANLTVARNARAMAMQTLSIGKR